MASVDYLLAMRALARAANDRNQVAAINADLARWGWPDRGPTFEAAVPAATEQTVLRKRGRPKLPRCEHGNIADRCVECDQDTTALAAYPEGD